jgi:hypothetical protein
VEGSCRDRPEQNHSKGRISIVDNSELTKLMSYVGADNSGSAKLLLPMPLCGFHVVGGSRRLGLTYSRGTDPVYHVLALAGKWFDRIDRSFLEISHWAFSCINKGISTSSLENKMRSASVSAWKL